MLDRVVAGFPCQNSEVRCQMSERVVGGFHVRAATQPEKDTRFGYADTESQIKPFPPSDEGGGTRAARDGGRDKSDVGSRSGRLPCLPGGSWLTKLFPAVQKNGKIRTYRRAGACSRRENGGWLIKLLPSMRNVKIRRNQSRGGT